MQYDSLQALQLLKQGTGRQDTQFREGQEEAIRHLVEGRRRQLLVQKTGWGKSFVYFIATRLLREAGLGPTLLVSPLLALMRNQIAAADARRWCASGARDPPPAWVAAIPSQRHPHLVPDFARRLADALDLPFSDVLRKTGGRPEQKSMENSDRQARNVLGSLIVANEAILTGPVLLVDDVVDSRWTFTVAAWELRRRECGPVWPLALASAGGRS